MKISIITVVYNRANTLKQTIFSVFGQTYKNIEYIVIDGESEDGTAELIKEYENKINYWISEKDNGIYNAMNKGIEAATGEYIQFLNADDVLVNENIIENIVHEIERASMPDVLSAPIWVVDEKRHVQKLLENEIDMNRIQYGHSLPHPGMFVKRNLLKKYRFNENYEIASDFELILRCIMDNKTFSFIDEPVVFFGNDGISTSLSIKHIKKRYNEVYDILAKHLGTQSAKDFGKEKNWLLSKQVLKKFLENLHCMGFIRRIQGWQEHRCTNEFCRWCKSGEKTNQ